MKEYTLKHPIKSLEGKEILNVAFRNRLTARDLLRISKEGGPQMQPFEEGCRRLAAKLGLDYEGEILSLDEYDLTKLIDLMFEDDPT